ETNLHSWPQLFGNFEKHTFINKDCFVLKINNFYTSKLKLLSTIKLLSKLFKTCCITRSIYGIKCLIDTLAIELKNIPMLHIIVIALSLSSIQHCSFLIISNTIEVISGKYSSIPPSILSINLSSIKVEADNSSAIAAIHSPAALIGFKTYSSKNQVSSSPIEQRLAQLVLNVKIHTLIQVNQNNHMHSLDLNSIINNKGSTILSTVQCLNKIIHKCCYMGLKHLRNLPLINSCLANTAIS
ncbi:hypothetical protein AGLY_010037, partial [Aphis glycines]